MQSNEIDSLEKAWSMRGDVDFMHVQYEIRPLSKRAMIVFGYCGYCQMSSLIATKPILV